MDTQAIRAALAAAPLSPTREAAVLIPLVEGEGGLHIVLEVRALTLDVQPGDVCLPGGGIEAGETPQEAAVRETCEELLVSAGQIELMGCLGTQPGPGGLPLHVFVGQLRGYEGTFSHAEVDRVFELSLDWLLTHDPEVYDVTLEARFPDDYPWELVPGGRAYAWRNRVNHVPFYRGTDPLVWGATARVLARFAKVLRRD